MFKKLKKYVCSDDWGIILLLSILGSSMLLYAETEINPDELFTQARSLAFQGERATARELCRTILAEYPDYHDVRILLGRVYAWDGLYDSARVHLKQVIERKPQYKDAWYAISDLEIWAQQYSQALTYIDRALQYYPNDNDLLYKKALVLKNLDQLSQAATILNNLLHLNPSHKKGRSLYRSIERIQKQSKLTLRYTYDRFETAESAWRLGCLHPDRDPWQMVSLDYERLISLGTLIARLNYARRFDISAYQLELDAYPSLRAGTYAYVSLGWSAEKIFPRYRGGLEFYQQLPYTLVGSLGTRYMQFDNLQVVVMTCSVGKYYKNYWFNLRTYLTPQEVSFSRSVYLTARWYTGPEQSYVSLLIGTGTSPDQLLTSKEAEYRGSRKIGTSGQYLVLPDTFFQWNINWENYEISQDDYLKNCQLILSVSRRF